MERSPTLEPRGDHDTERTIERVLLRFEPLIAGERHRALARGALEWSLSRAASGLRPPAEAARADAGDLERLAKEAFLSSAFEAFCAPSGATLEESLLSIRFLLLFFKADDASPDQLTSFADWLGGDRSRAPIPGEQELRDCLADLTRSFDAMGRDARDFCGAVLEMCRAMCSEKTADKLEMTEATFRRLRKHTVAVPSYTECWRTIRGIVPSEAIRQARGEGALLDLACELVYLVNDIGSMERDEQDARANPRQVDPNYVLLLARSRGGDRDLALREAITLHNRKVVEMRRQEEILEEQTLRRDGALTSYLDILRCTVRGNLAVTRHLVPFRYPGMDIHLAKLDDL